MIVILQSAPLADTDKDATLKRALSSLSDKQVLQLAELLLEDTVKRENDEDGCKYGEILYMGSFINS